MTISDQTADTAAHTLDRQLEAVLMVADEPIGRAHV